MRRWSPPAPRLRFNGETGTTTPAMQAQDTGKASTPGNTIMREQPAQTEQTQRIEHDHYQPPLRREGAFGFAQDGLRLIAKLQHMAQYQYIQGSAGDRQSLRFCPERVAGLAAQKVGVPERGQTQQVACRGAAADLQTALTMHVGQQALKALVRAGGHRPTQWRRIPYGKLFA